MNLGKDLSTSTGNLIVISYRDHKTEAFFVPRAKPKVRKEPRFHGRAYERYFIHRETDAHSGTKR